MDSFILLVRDFGFPAAVAVFVLLRLERRLAHVEQCLVRICVILSATSGVQVDEGEEEAVVPLLQPLPHNGDGQAKAGG